MSDTPRTDEEESRYYGKWAKSDFARQHAQPPANAQRLSSAPSASGRRCSRDDNRTFYDRQDMALEVYAHLHPDDLFDPLDNITIVKDDVKIQLTGSEWNRIKGVLNGEEGIAYSYPKEGSYTPHTAFVWTKEKRSR